MSVVLCMIVRNEAPVIGRCLQAVRPFIDRWVICDTGSDDGTQERVLEALPDLPGELIEHKWINFGHNRTQALQEARRVADGQGYVLVIDADDTFDADPDFQWPAMDRDAYHLLHEMGNTQWWRAQLFRADQPWQYKGVVHEIAELPGGSARGPGRIPGVTVRCSQDGARRGDKFKYLKDAELLRRAVAEDPSDLRALFYLAQSYRDAGQPHMALDVYTQRAAIEPPDEEAWFSQLQVGRIARALGRPDEAAEALLAAYRMRPQRMEPVLDLANFYRRRCDYAMANLYAALAINTRPPEDGLFIEPAAHAGWRAFEEFGLAQFYMGDVPRARRLFEGALSMPGPSDADRIRLERNLECAGGRPIVAQPLDGEIKDRQPGHEASLADLRRWYVERCTTDAMALSLQAAALAVAVCEHDEPDLVLDLGSGFSSLALRSRLPDLCVTSVDDSARWLVATADAVVDRGLPDHGLCLWKDLQPPPGGYGFVLHDLGDANTRVSTMERVWELVAPKGLIFFDDMHMHPIRTAVRRLLDQHKHEAFDTAELTRDAYGRHGLLVRKLEASL